MSNKTLPLSAGSRIFKSSIHTSAGVPRPGNSWEPGGTSWQKGQVSATLTTANASNTIWSFVTLRWRGNQNRISKRPNSKCQTNKSRDEARCRQRADCNSRELVIPSFPNDLTLLCKTPGYTEASRPAEDLTTRFRRRRRQVQLQYSENSPHYNCDANCSSQHRTVWDDRMPHILPFFFYSQKLIKTWAGESLRRINHLKNPIRTDREDSAVFLKR